MSLDKSVAWRTSAPFLDVPQRRRINIIIHPSMTYAIIQPPFTLKFREMSKKDLASYFRWFHMVQPERVNELTRAIRQTTSFSNWQPDLTPASLDPLGDWFASEVKTRTRTQDEIEEIKSRSAYPIDFSGEELTNLTFSLSMDIGMYLSQVFLKNHPSLHWEQPFGSKRFIDYGQPVLTGFGNVPFNPVRMLVGLAYGISGKKRDGKGLREIYDIWSKFVSI